MEDNKAAAEPVKRQPPGLLGILIELVWKLGLIAAVVFGTLSLVYFPYATDAPLSQTDQADQKKYYAAAYAKQEQSSVEADENSDYVKIGKKMAETFNIKGQIAHFASENGLTGKKVLDIGSGRGYLQDVVDDYTGLDISSSAKRFYHKKFVLGSATAMPFIDGEFDGAWSIWVLEHVPNPQAALVEMRRVIKDGGMLFLFPAWNASPYSAQGYQVRPYSDFGWSGKWIKATMRPRNFLLLMSEAPVRELRSLSEGLGAHPTNFHYHRLVPNYEKYWMNDSDAVNALDRHETALWFTSRGDECLNCPGNALSFDWNTINDPLILKIHKPAVASSRPTSTPAPVLPPAGSLSTAPQPGS